MTSTRDVTHGLLAQISQQAMADDYEQDPEGPNRTRVGWVGMAVLLVIGLVVITAAVHTNRNEDDAQRNDLITQLEQRREALDERREVLAALRAEVVRLEAEARGGGDASEGAKRSVTNLGVWAGTVPVTGDGVRMVVDDLPRATSDRERVLDSDLQRIVNGLWAAGAEAIAVNGLRLTARSAIRWAGSAITVNYDSLTRPYRIEAIGDRSTLASRFAETATGQAWLDLASNAGFVHRMEVARNLHLPAATPPAARFAERSEPQ